MGKGNKGYLLPVQTCGFYDYCESARAFLCISLRSACKLLLSPGLLPHDLATDALSLFLAVSAVYLGTGDMQQPIK